MDRKNIIIGLDGATWEVIDYFIHKNVMPSLKKIKEMSSYGELSSTIVPITPSAWASMITGCMPSTTGIFDFLKSVDGTYNWRLVNSQDIKVPTMANILLSYGRKVSLINVPMTFPPNQNDGYLLTGLLTPIGEKNISYPENLVEELKKHGINYRIDTELHANRSKLFTDHDYEKTVFGNGAEVFFRDLNELLEIRKKTVDYLMHEKNWDYFMFVLIGIDRIQHHLWDYIMQPEIDSSMTRNIGNYFRRVDEIIGDIYENFKNNANIFIVSDHGFSKLHGIFMIDVWLLNKGYLKLNLSKMPWIKSIIKKMLNGLNINPKKLFGNLLKKENISRLMISSHNIDWSNTVAYSTETNGININLKGRDILGVVEKEKYDEIRDVIIDELMNVTDHAGVKIVRKALKKENIFKEGDLNHVPDIIIEFYNEYLFHTRGSNNLSEDQDMFINHEWQKGFHIREGVFLATGEDIYRGKKVEGIKMEDILPTLLALNNEKIPTHLDGRIVREIIKREINEKYTDFKFNHDSNSYEYAEESGNEIIEKLKSLGYL